jgi:hypothetical protein
VAVTTKVIQSQAVPGNLRKTVTEVTFPVSTTEGGEPLTAKQLGLKAVRNVLIQPVALSESEEYASVFTYKIETLGKGTIIPWSSKTGKIVVKEKDLSKVKIQVTAYGV